MKVVLLKGCKVLMIICIVHAQSACVSNNLSKSGLYRDYSLVSGDPSYLLKEKDTIVNGNKAKYIIVSTVNSLSQEIFLKNYNAEFIDRIKMIKTPKQFVYQIFFAPSLTDKGGVFWVYRDSTLKEYNFGMQLGGPSGPITGSFCLFHNHKRLCYRFQINVLDTANLINNIWDLDSQYFTNRTDTLIEFVDIR